MGLGPGYAGRTDRDLSQPEAHWHDSDAEVTPVHHDPSHESLNNASDSESQHEAQASSFKSTERV
jgi:hypothetical protein